MEAHDQMSATRSDDGPTTFRAWRYGIAEELVSKRLSPFVIDEVLPPARDNYETVAQFTRATTRWENDNTAAKAVIINHCTDRMLEEYSDISTAFELWRALAEEHGFESRFADRLLDHQELANIQYNGTDMELFIHEFTVKECLLKMSEPGDSANEVLLANLIRCIEPYFEAFVDRLRAGIAWLQMPEPLPKIDAVLRHLWREHQAQINTAIVEAAVVDDDEMEDWNPDDCELEEEQIENETPNSAEMAETTTQNIQEDLQTVEGPQSLEDAMVTVSEHNSNQDQQTDPLNSVEHPFEVETEQPHEEISENERQVSVGEAAREPINAEPATENAQTIASETNLVVPQHNVPDRQLSIPIRTRSSRSLDNGSTSPRIKIEDKDDSRLAEPSTKQLSGEVPRFVTNLAQRQVSAGRAPTALQRYEQLITSGPNPDPNVQQPPSVVEPKKRPASRMRSRGRFVHPRRRYRGRSRFPEPSERRSDEGIRRYRPQDDNRTYSTWSDLPGSSNSNNYNQRAGYSAGNSRSRYPSYNSRTQRADYYRPGRGSDRDQERPSQGLRHREGSAVLETVSSQRKEPQRDTESTSESHINQSREIRGGPTEYGAFGQSGR